MYASLSTKIFAPLALVLVLMSVVVSCSGDDDGTGSATTDPGPNPTSNDPGPNDTSSGPATVQGTVRFVATTGCIALETSDQGRLALVFTGFSLSDDGSALVADDDGRTLAHDGDSMVVTGRPGGEAGADCGTAFTVESLNTVVPADR